MRTYEELVTLFTEMELDPTNHAAEREDYDRAIDFYMENVKDGSYVSYYLETTNVMSQEERDTYDLDQMHQDIIQSIKDDVEGIQDYD